MAEKYPQDSTPPLSNCILCVFGTVAWGLGWGHLRSDVVARTQDGGQLLGVLLADLGEAEVNQLEQRVRAAILVDLARASGMVSGGDWSPQDV